MTKQTCLKCLKIKDWKYDTKKLDNICNHWKKYHYNCFMELCNDIKDENGNICCYHCYIVNKKKIPLKYNITDKKKKIMNQISYNLNLINIDYSNGPIFQKRVICRKIFEILDGHLYLFKDDKNFLMVIKNKCEEIIDKINRGEEVDNINLKFKMQIVYKKLLKYNF